MPQTNPSAENPPVKNRVQLITYPDSLGGDLSSLHEVLEKHFNGVFEGGIHILPPFPSSGDRGFAPLTYLEIEPQFGDWDDVRQIGEKHDILLDLMVNHISAKSLYFLDFLKHGRDSEWSDLFLSVDKVFPDAAPTEEEIQKIFLRREEPYSDFTIEDSGEVVRVWTTFGKVTPSEQIDLDVNSELARGLLADFLKNFAENSINIVRLDAIGFVVKKPGSSFFMVEPEVYEFLEWITEVATGLGLVLLPEVHAHHDVQNKLAERGYWIYDFILPYMILESLMFSTSSTLTDYLAIRPHRQFTMLDCHDGVPVKPDLDDLVETEDLQKVVDACLERGANLSLIYSSKHASDDGFNVHQIRCSYYSMLDSNDDAYIAARAIQFFAPGIPQVYYVGLLAGENDEENVRRTGEGREINRHNYSMAEIDDAAQAEVVQRLVRLIRFRNDYPAFDGEFTVLDSDDITVRMAWQDGESRCELSVDLATKRSVIDYRRDDGQTVSVTI